MYISAKNISHSVISGVFEWMATNKGWFLSDAESLLQLDFSRGADPAIYHKSDSARRLILPRDKFLDCGTYLKGEENIGPEDEPSPLKNPVLDELSEETHRRLIDFTISQNIPFISKLPWPGGKSFALAITHDVDLVRKYGLKSLLSDAAGGRMGDLKTHFQQSVFRNNPFWNFEDLLKSHRHKKIMSTFFFLARSWENYQYRYNIRREKFRRLFRMLQEEGHEIALHSSRYAFDHPGRISREKEKLESILGETVQGVRQHFLRLKFPDAWQYFEESRFIYDSSSGYNNAIGYRAGTTLPFHPLQGESNKKRGLYEMPFCIMDYPWFDAAIAAADPFEETVQQVEKCRGLLNILWHPSNLAESAYQPLWKKMWEILDSRDYYNASLRNIVSWWQNRSAVRMVHLDFGKEGIRFTLSNPDTIKGLSLEIVSPQRLIVNRQIAFRGGEKHYIYHFHIPEIRAGESNYLIAFQ